MNASVETLRVIIFGASGMVGAAVLDECLKDPRVSAVLSVGRSSCKRQDPKLKELLHEDLMQLDSRSSTLKGYNACFFTLGVSSIGMNEADYTKISYDLTLSIAQALLPSNPDLAFTYVSGAGTDTTEKGERMWARVKGRTENGLLKLPFRTAVMFRLGGLIPLKGFRSKTRLYRILLMVLGPILPLLARLFPTQVLTPRILGRAMIAAGLGLTDKHILEVADIYELGR